MVAEAYLSAPHGWTRRTLDSTRNRVIAFCTWMVKHGALLPSEITDKLLDQWMEERTHEVARRTLNRDLRAAKRMLVFGAQRLLCTVCGPVASRPYVREARRSKFRYVPDAREFSAAVKALQEMHSGAAIAVRCLYAAGLRIEELRRLTDADVGDGVVHIRPQEGPMATAEPTKGYRERSIPVHPSVTKLLREFLAWRAGKGGKGKPVGCGESWLVKMLAKGCRAAGVPKFGLHDLRAAFATDAFDRGIGLVVIQRWLGHADPQTTQGYIRPRRSDTKVVAPVPGGLKL